MVTIKKFSNRNIFPNNFPNGEVATVIKHEECIAYLVDLQPVLTCNNTNISIVLINNNIEQNFDSVCYEVTQNVDTTYLGSFNSVITTNDKTTETLEVSVSRSMEMNQSQSHSNNNQFKQQKVVTSNDNNSSQNIFPNNNLNELASTISNNKESNVLNDYLQPVSTCQDANINTELINNERRQFVDSFCYEVAHYNDTTYSEISNSVSTTNDEISHYREASNSYSNEIKQSDPYDHTIFVFMHTITQILMTHLSRLSRHRLESIVFIYLSNNACLL